MVTSLLMSLPVCSYGVDCRNMDYGDLFNQYFRDPSTMQPRPFRPWTGVLEGKGRQLNGTYCPQAMQLFHLLKEWREQEEQEDERGFFKAMKRKVSSLYRLKKALRKKSHLLSLSGHRHLSRRSEMAYLLFITRTQLQGRTISL